MKQHTISKRKIIVALMTEPLIVNHFFEIDNDPKCSVCAVGAILRVTGAIQTNSFGRHVTRNFNASSYKDQIPQALADGNYLGALSIYHESQGKGKKVLGVKHRMKLANFVNKYFPSSVTFTD